jgi:deoxyribodipyrimidine photo-lyase
VLPLYVIEPDVIGAADFDAMHWQFIRESLTALDAALHERGVRLCVRRGEITEVLEVMRKTWGIDNLWAHEETGNAITFARDQRVAAWAVTHGVAYREIPQNGVVRRLRNRDGWSRQWERRMAEPIAEPPAVVSSAWPGENFQLPSSTDLGLTESPRQVDLRGGEPEAWKVLESFFKTRGHGYRRKMSSPKTAFESCSRISPYLSWGCISMRSVVQFARGASGSTLPKTDARSFLSRCHWHCHFMQKLESEPEIEFHAFNRACDDLRSGSHDLARLEAWQQGRTGYPFIDACMRALKARGWINFRMRAMLVSFASYHLWLDWRCFKDWLACQFIDYEPGIHISQVQMQSGLTGINTLRIYNPIKQGRDQDPTGAFIREWVPELARVAGDFIHEPWTMPDAAQAEADCRIGQDYPHPVVDHQAAVKHARRQFAELRHRDDYWAAAREVMHRHGSRKSTEKRPKRARKKPNEQSELRLGDV